MARPIGYIPELVAVLDFLRVMFLKVSTARTESKEGQVDKSVFLIVGCQRSGSTLLESIFNAHPSVHVVGEERCEAYHFFDRPESLADFAEPVIGLRIPAATHRIDHAIHAFPTARVLFTMRDPRDVVTSMRKLKRYSPETGAKVSWLEVCGHDEIAASLQSLSPDDPLVDRLNAVRQHTDDRNDARYGAICWALKNRFLPLYQASPLPTEVVRYEELTKDSEPCLRRLCTFLQLEWHDNLLRHHDYSSGFWAGTDKAAPIHQQSLGAYKGHLTQNEQETMSALIQPEIAVSGYGELSAA